MPNTPPSSNTSVPTARVIDVSAEVKKIWGPKWNEPSISYEFGDRKFYLRTQDAGIYDPPV